MKAGSLCASCACTFATIFFVAGEYTFKDTFKNTSSTLFWTLSAIVAINTAILAAIVPRRLVNKIEEKFLQFIEERRTVLSANKDLISCRKCLCFLEAIVPLENLLNIRPNIGARGVKADDPPR